MQITVTYEFPRDFSYPIILYLKQRVMLLWTKTKEERSFWVEELQKFIEETCMDQSEDKKEFIERLIMKDKSFAA